MTNRIKISLTSGDHSTGRGIGVYGENLRQALMGVSDITLTNNNPDIIHYPFFDLFYHTLPFAKPKPTIVTIHDLTPLVMSSRYPMGIKGTLNFLLQWLSLRSVSAIITDSQNSKKDIVNFLRINPQKIFVTPLAVSRDYYKKPTVAQMTAVKDKYHLPDKFILTLASGPNPNKNLPSIAEATDRLGIPLVLCGNIRQEVKRPVHPELIDLVRLEVYNHVLYPGRVSNEEFNCLLHLASLYVHPSLYEGFGLTLLEAMTAGCLIASSNTSSMPEIYHDSAITFNPHKIRSIEKAIIKALSLTPRQKQTQIDEAKKKASQFTWEKTGNQTAEVYRHVFTNTTSSLKG